MSEHPNHRVHRKPKSRTFSRPGKVRAKREREKVRDKGLWVYCVRRAAVHTPAESIPGIQPGTKVHTITLKDIEAVASVVDLQQFGARQLKEKLATDLSWTERSVQRHHDIIVNAGGEGTVVPMKFGTIFATRKNLEAMLKKYYRKFTTLLVQLKGREEWGVKVFLDKARFIELLKKNDPEIQQFEIRKGKTPEGMRWYVDRKIDEAVQKKFEKVVEDDLVKIIQGLEKYAEQVVINNPSPPELTGREMALHTACLLKKEARRPFQENVRKLFAGFKARGLSGEITGPWPLYNFVGIKK
ncbi:MAG: GvpL/GvpF family gas vesicle protein [Patescibacteria group bacterium]